MTTEQASIVRPATRYDSNSFEPALLGRGWDDIEVGYEHTDFPDHTLTVTDAMVDQFAEVTGDFNPIHLDESFARRSIHRRKIAHGALLTSLVIGQYHGSGYTYGTTLALLSTKATFLRACPVGHEVYSVFRVIAKEHEPHPKRGKVTYHSWLRCVDDHEPFIEVELEVLIRRLVGKSAMRRLGVERDTRLPRNRDGVVTVHRQDHPNGTPRS